MPDQKVYIFLRARTETTLCGASCRIQKSLKFSKRGLHAPSVAQGFNLSEFQPSSLVPYGQEKVFLLERATTDDSAS